MPDKVIDVDILTLRNEEEELIFFAFAMEGGAVRVILLDVTGTLQVKV